jgi:hypothetical protein
MNSPPTWLRFLLLGLVSVIALAGWCGYWLLVARQAQAGIASLEARLLADGFAVDCGERSWGGFPFRIVMRCVPLSVRLAARPGYSFALARAEFLAQAYDLGHIIAVAGSPGHLTRPRGERRRMDFTRAAASYLSDGDDVVSVVIDGLSLAGLLTAEQLSAHMRLPSRPGESAEFAVEIRRAGFVPADGNDVIDRFSVQGALPLPPARPGAAMDIHRLDAASGAISAHGSGRVGLDAVGRAEGRLELDVVALRQLLDRLASRGALAPDDIEAGVAFLSLLGQSPDGSIRIDLRAERGRLYFGPFRLGEVPPLL